MTERDLGTGVDPAIGDDVQGHQRIDDTEAAENVRGHSLGQADPEAGEDDVAGHLMGGEIHPDIHGDSRTTP